MNICIVDDSKFMRKMIIEELKDDHFHFFEASNFTELLEVLKTETIHLITLDIQMPDRDGIEICRELRDGADILIDKHLPIIMVTDSDDQATREKVFKAGATDYILKSFHPGELLYIVRALVYKNITKYQNIQCLVLDDSKMFRKLIHEIISSVGIIPIEATNGKEGLELLQKHQKDIDIILTDLDMPEMDGLTFCQKIRRELNIKDLPIIFLTGSESGSFIRQVFSSGANDYVHKNFIQEELLARIESHLIVSKLNQKRIEVQEKLLQINLEKDHLLSIRAHDLRSPLNSILGFAELISMQSQEAVVKDFATRIIASGQQLNLLIEDILDHHKIKDNKKEIKFESIELKKVLDMSIDMISQNAKDKKISLVKDYPIETVVIEGDQLSLIRAFNNLISNAIKFTPTGKSVTIKLETGDKAAKVQIKDQGIGIDKNEIKDLFIPFKKSKKGTSGEKGTGLGLSIVKHIVEAHDGEINIESDIGKGTDVILAFHKRSA